MRKIQLSALIIIMTILGCSGYKEHMSNVTEPDFKIVIDSIVTPQDYRTFTVVDKYYYIENGVWVSNSKVNDIKGKKGRYYFSVEKNKNDSLIDFKFKHRTHSVNSTTYMTIKSDHLVIVEQRRDDRKSRSSSQFEYGHVIRKK